MGRLTPVRGLLGATAVVAGVALVVRAWIGPFSFGLSVRSPINAESIFAAAFVLLILTAKRFDGVDGAQPFQPQDLAVAASLVVPLAVIFGRSFFIGFVADDYSHILAASKANAADVAHWFTVPASDNLFFRPVAMISYWIDSAWAGFSPVRWHIAAWLWHMLNVALVYTLARRLGLAAMWAMVAAALFGVHGSRPEVVTWVAARFDLVATAAVLIAIHAFISYRETRRVGWLITILATGFCGFLSKESAFALPLLMVAIACYLRPFRAADTKAIVLTAVLAGSAFLYRLAILGGIGGYVDPSGRPGVLGFNAPLVLKAFALRIWAVLFFPINWTDPLSFVLALSLTLAVIALLALAWRGLPDRLAIFGLAFTLIAALPVYHLLLIGPDLEKSRVLYLGSVGFAIFFAALCRNVPERLGLVAAVLVVSFQLAALRHNLTIWDRVSQIHLRACEFLGDEAARSPVGVVAVGMPNTWDGVYMLRTGLPECIEIRHGIPAAHVHLVDTLEGAFRYPNLPIYRWNDATASIVRTR